MWFLTRIVWLWTVSHVVNSCPLRLLLLLIRMSWTIIVVSTELFSHRTGTLRCLQKEMAAYRHWSVSLWRDPDDVSHCRILSPDKTEWRLISATLCGWRRRFVADQLWFMTRIREDWSARKRRFHLQIAAGISQHSALSEDRIQQCLGLTTRTQISVCKSPFLSAGTAVSLFPNKFNGCLLCLWEADEAAITWLTTYGSSCMTITMVLDFAVSVSTDALTTSLSHWTSCLKFLAF